MEKEIEKKEAEQSLIKKLSLINQNDLLFLKNKKDKIIVILFFFIFLRFQKRAKTIRFLEKQYKYPQHHFPRKTLSYLPTESTIKDPFTLADESKRTINHTINHDNNSNSPTRTISPSKQYLREITITRHSNDRESRNNSNTKSNTTLLNRSYKSNEIHYNPKPSTKTGMIHFTSINHPPSFYKKSGTHGSNYYQNILRNQKAVIKGKKQCKIRYTYIYIYMYM